MMLNEITTTECERLIAVCMSRLEALVVVAGIAKATSVGMKMPGVC